MALNFADNFSIYGTNTALMLNGVYAAVTGSTLQSDPDGLSGGHVLYLANNPNVGSSALFGPRFVLNANQTGLGMGMRVWFPVLPSGSSGWCIPMQWRNASNSPLASVTVESTGRIAFRSGDWNGTVIAQTTNPVITANGWYHLEGYLDIDTSSFELRVEGISVLTASITIADVVSQVQISGRTTSQTAVQPFYIKDFVVWDKTGSYNNTFLGSVLVTNLVPTSDVSLNWTPSTGTNGYSILDNIPPVDTAYISAAPSVAAYVAGMSDLPPTVTSVKGLITFVRAAKSDGGDGSLQSSLISDPAGTPATVNGANRPITVAQTYWRDVFEQDPKTSAAWTPTAVNAVEMQINRTT